MSPPQHMEALARANEIRLAGARHKRALRGSPRSLVYAALEAPSEGLGRMRLCSLLAPSGAQGILYGFGPGALNRAVANLNEQWTKGRRWHSELRLGDLNLKERKRLIEALEREMVASGKQGKGPMRRVRHKMGAKVAA